MLAFVRGAPCGGGQYGELRTDLRGLRRRAAAAAVALAELEKRIGGLSHLAIVVRTDDFKAGERVVDALAATLKELPPSLVAQVHWRGGAGEGIPAPAGAPYPPAGEPIAPRRAPPPPHPAGQPP